MRTGAVISGAGHAALVALAVWGLPWLKPRESEAIRVTEVSFVTEAEFAAAQAAAPAEAPRAEAAPPEPPPAAEAAAEPAPDAPEPEVAEAPVPEEEIAALAPQFDPSAPLESQAPDAASVVPRVVTLAPPTAATAPRPRPTPRIEATPAPPPPELARPAETPVPEVAPEPEPEVVEEPRPAEAPPEAAPEPVAEPSPPATLALASSGRPLPRRGNVAARPAEPAEEPAEDAVRQAAIQSAVAEAAGATPPTPPTPPSETPPTQPAAATSLPVGPPLTSGEKDGLRLAVQRCWNVPAGLRDAQELKVVLSAELAADGAVINASIRLLEPSPAPDGRFQQAYEAGRRALIRCSPYSGLPREKFAQWRNIEVVFNPEGMLSW